MMIIDVKRINIPTVYLDTCVLIEFSKLQKGICTNTYKHELQATFTLLENKMRKKVVLCPLGNQLVEMGVSEHRKPARDFLYRFTNAELISPCEIRAQELDLAYEAYMRKDNMCYLRTDSFLRTHDTSGTPFIIHVAPVYKPKKLTELRDNKKQTVSILNNMKTSGKREKSFENQLDVELKADAELMLNTITCMCKSEESFACYLDMIGQINSRTGITLETNSEEQLSRMSQYFSFLLSEYHHKMPYIWITSTLWAHRMQEDKRICDGDNLDTVWAAAYLPFVDYVITDISFSEMLNSSGLAHQYGTKVYSMRDLNEFNKEIDSLVLDRGGAAE